VVLAVLAGEIHPPYPQPSPPLQLSSSLPSAPEHAPRSASRPSFPRPPKYHRLVDAIQRASRRGSLAFSRQTHLPRRAMHLDPQQHAWRCRSQNFGAEQLREPAKTCTSQSTPNCALAHVVIRTSAASLQQRRMQPCLLVLTRTLTLWPPWGELYLGIATPRCCLAVHGSPVGVRGP
jgi:hypothetical protein